jgi:hypothetical protein
MSLLLFLAALAGESMGPATAATEMLGTDAPDEFEIGYQTRSDTQSIIELVDPPETVQDWSRLITLQLFYNAAQTPGLETYFSRWRDAMKGSCVGMTDTVERGTVDGRPAIKASMSCSKNSQTGKPENLGAVLVQGEVNLAMVQVAFRRPMNSDDAALIDRITGSLKLCDQRNFDACSGRKATGFIATK